MSHRWQEIEVKDEYKKVAIKMWKCTKLNCECIRYIKTPSSHYYYILGSSLHESSPDCDILRYKIIKDSILDKVSEFTNIPKEEILSSKSGRRTKISIARLMFYMACNVKGISYYDLSVILNKHRSTVFNCVSRSKSMKNNDRKKYTEFLKIL